MGCPCMEPDTSQMAMALLRSPLSRSFSTYAFHCASATSIPVSVPSEPVSEPSSLSVSP